ncbi:MAG TPA: methylenetetrahydrofolate reductase C-terminal domain-containing protein [Rectinemataceae bacterium]|nr:methylenetetrahydrofolate reductase C-terminal domain-containing protein [Rectinemataceae bacterium]
MIYRFEDSVLDTSTFSVTWELVPGRGAREKPQASAMASAEQAAKGGKIHAVTVTDNPGGTPAILADYLGEEILKLGIEPLVHFTCKDKNRNQMESQLYAMDRAGLRNLLVMTGDYTVSGFGGRPKPVFDLDPIQALDLVRDMNEGLQVPGPKGPIVHQRSDFFPGCAISPFKATEAEQMAQYYKLRKKVAAGARFVVTQLGYDARKFHEVLTYMRLNKLDLPLIGNIYFLPYGAAKMMNRNDLPGCVVTDELLAQIEKERSAEDTGLGARLDRAAKMYAVLKGMGYAGVHLGGQNVKYEQIEYVIGKGEELTPAWPDLVREFDFPMPKGFYLFEKDPATGLNSPVPVDRRKLPRAVFVGPGYHASRLMHRLVFSPGKAFFPLLRRLYSLKRKPRRHALEHIGKVILYDCKDCGDCALLDMAYLCPMSQCPKNQRNGACGGSRDGWCEVYPNEKKCVWVRVYGRLKSSGEEESLGAARLPPADWELYQTSSWYNFYTGRDHSAGPLGIPKIEKESGRGGALARKRFLRR